MPISHLETTIRNEIALTKLKIEELRADRS